MNEPLKGKIAYATAVFSKSVADNYAKKGKKRGLVMSQVFMKDWVEDAVKWLKKRIEDHRPDFKWTKQEILDIIDGAFPDLCPSGDLIADKQNPQDIDKNKSVAD